MTNDYLYWVKRILVYITLFITLISTASTGQLLKLPILVSHYLEHQHKNHDIGFIDFLYMHYMGNDMDDDDDDRDMQLPFKSSPPNCYNQLPSLPVAAIPLTRQNQFSEKNEFTISSETALMDPSLASLFRPPRA